MRVVGFVQLALVVACCLVPVAGIGEASGLPDAGQAPAPAPRPGAPAEVAQALIVHWFLLQAGDGWAWVIVGGYGTRQECEAARERHPLGHWLICVRNERSRQLGWIPPAP
jgi:hypothetical protein